LNDKRKTLFIDIDGCILWHHNDTVDKIVSIKERVLDGVLEKFHEWEGESVYIVLTTARKESLRDITVKQLEAVGVTYDVLLMGVGNGTRYVINDEKPSNPRTAVAIVVPRNKGLGDVQLD